VVQPALVLLACADPAIPLAARLPPRAGDAVGALEDEPVRDALDGRVAPGEALAVDAAPRAQRRQLEPHGAVGAQHAVDDAAPGPPAGHRDLALEHDVADLPAPAGDAAVELERDEQLVAARVDGAAAPLVRSEPHPRVAEDEDGLERDEAQHPAG